MIQKKSMGSLFGRLLLLSFLILCFSCNKGSLDKESVLIKEELSFQLDTVFIDPTQSSQIGFIQISKDKIFYVDQAYGFVEEFTLEGESGGVKKRELDGPDELQGISELVVKKDGYMIRHDWMFYHYDFDWKFLGKSNFQSPATVSFQELQENPKGEYIEMYELEHYSAKTVQIPGGFLVTKIDVEHPLFNAFTTREYYREARVLGKINPFDGEVVEILGARPKTYEEYAFVPFHSKFDFHWTGTDRIYMTYEVDSMIYVYDPSWNLIERFGAAGKNMKTDYEESQILEVAFDTDLYRYSRKNMGYYKDVFVDEQNGLVFRTYRQGTDQQDLWDETYNPLRLQIFKDGQLVGDHPVPGRFRILGKIGERYVADGLFDERNEQQGFYLMTIN